MKFTEKLLQEIRKKNHQGLPPTNLLYIIKEYRPLGQYMLKKFGWRSWWSFWYTKLFVSDEGGEYAISDYFIYRFFPWLLRKPGKIEIEHTTVCNKRCIFCAHTYWKEKKEQMSFRQFKKILDDLKGLKWINMAGIGSNFLNKDFIKMIKYARQKHINVNFVDEFDFLDEDMARSIVRMGVNSIFISFDAATKKTYEKIKKGCSFDRAVANIRMLLKIKSEMGSPFPVVHFRYLVTRLNYKEMPDYINLVRSFENKGVRSRVAFTGLITFPGIEEHYLPLSQVPEDILQQTFKTALENNINLYFSHEDADNLPPIDNCVRWTEPFILVNGDVISDCAILMQTQRKDLKSKSFGNAFDTSFLEIWNSKKYKNFRKLVVKKAGKVPDICLNCCAFNSGDRSKIHGVAPYCAPLEN
jgi:MoaA/NifB/PqqE/SkfB family radical SAM enzyme